MNKYILSVIFTLILCLSVKAQTSNAQIKVVTELENEPLFGATVYFKKLEKNHAIIFQLPPQFDIHRRIFGHFFMGEKIGHQL